MKKKKETILIVEDMKENIDMLIAILKDEFSIRVALTGEDALKQVEQSLPQLILLDVVLPGISGFEVCSKLKDNPSTSHIPVIFLTALSNDVDERMGLDVGGSDYINKPFNASLVKLRIKKQLELYNYQHRLEEKVSKRTRELENVKDSLLESLVIVTEYRDRETGDHVKRGQKYVGILANLLSSRYPELLDSAKKDLIIQASALHDIGKIALPDRIILKKGQLTDQEYDMIKDHARIGGEILRRASNNMETYEFMQYAQLMATYHHERWDGTGYPFGLKGEEIPLCARIMSIVDVYDALTMDRPYKEAMTHEEAVSIIVNGDGRVEPQHFDPDILEIFAENHDLFL
ncbi:MAG: response regulator [Spirochaetales bacterium]|nr:response regulator [Spirochaetales bacterium]